MDKLTIGDLKKGMKIRVKDELINDYITLTIDYTHWTWTAKGNIENVTFAVGIDKQGTPYLLTNDSKLILYKEETIRNRIPVICSVCGKQMIIKEWMQANKRCGWWGKEDTFMIPHMNRSHPCTCGHLWLSTDALLTVGNILIWKC